MSAWGGPCRRPSHLRASGRFGMPRSAQTNWPSIATRPFVKRWPKNIQSAKSPRQSGSHRHMYTVFGMGSGLDGSNRLATIRAMKAMRIAGGVAGMLLLVWGGLLLVASLVDDGPLAA